MSNPLPFQPAKVHSPPARRDILTRERLNAWLDKAVAGRVVLVVAEAGSGKTTLLADWARHTLRRTTWYRLESDDRDWLTFVRHLVAGGRELEADFGVATLDLLQRLGPGGPTQHEIFTSIARDLAESGATGEHGLTLIIDDAHIVDDCAEVQVIIGMLLERTGPGFSVIISSRAEPPLPMGKVRARGGVDGLTGGDLCFDPGETERLFRVAYRKPLDADVLTDLHARTEGWAALLTLVRAGLTDHDGTDAHALVASLSSAQGDLYEFLAEEVMAGLDAGLQHFLSRVAILMAVTPEASGLVLDAAPDDLEGHLREAERLGLLTRPDRGSAHRFHPLVREFLLARLAEEVGPDEVRQLHLKVAAALEPTDWLGSAWHYLQCGATVEVARILDVSAGTILASGDFERAIPYLARGIGDPHRPSSLMLRSRIEFDRGNGPAALALAREATQTASGTDALGTALVNLASIQGVGGFARDAVDSARQALGQRLTDAQRFVAQATVSGWEASEEGDLSLIADDLAELADQQERLGHTRYAGITRLNRAGILLWTGRAADSLQDARRAERLLGARNPSVERVAATSMQAVSLAQLGRLEEARSALQTDLASTLRLARDEAAIEAARMHADFGSDGEASSALALIDPDQLAGGYRDVWVLTRGVVSLRLGDLESARECAARLEAITVPDAAGKLRSLLFRSRTYMAAGDARAGQTLSEARRVAVSQGSAIGRVVADLLIAVSGRGNVSTVVERMSDDENLCLSLIAEELSSVLAEMTAPAKHRVVVEATSRPLRWRSALAREVQVSGTSARACADVLADIGTREDAAQLREMSAKRKDLRGSALRATRRLAPRLEIVDLGPVELLLGGQAVGDGMRRKVLALLCFLSSRSGMAATKDEILEALWPDLAPDTAGNSLHQTIYYLRRVFEPDYREGLSAGYVQFDGDVATLSPDLVNTSSRRCWRALSGPSAPDLDSVEAMLGLYRGRYALDFAYEDWSLAYRENLHAAVLGAAETVMVLSRADSQVERSITLGQTLLAIDPQADSIELALLRLYKRAGRRAAAAEQYAHYATYLRGELGVEPIPFDDV